MTELQSALDNAVLDALRESVGDDSEFLAELIDTFVADAPGQLESLCQQAESAAGAGDLEAVLAQVDGIDREWRRVQAELLAVRDAR